MKIALRSYKCMFYCGVVFGGRTVYTLVCAILHVYQSTTTTPICRSQTFPKRVWEQSFIPSPEPGTGPGKDVIVNKASPKLYWSAILGDNNNYWFSQVAMMDIQSSTLWSGLILRIELGPWLPPWTPGDVGWVSPLLLEGYSGMYMLIYCSTVPELELDSRVKYY